MQELGPVDLLVNVCGGVRVGAFGKASEAGVVGVPVERWADTFDLNLTPSVLFLHLPAH